MTDHKRRSSDKLVTVNGQSIHDRRTFDRNTGLHVVKLFSGDCYVTDKPDHMLVTILGSCVSACIRDPDKKVGGMNHFLLPHLNESHGQSTDDSTRYGAFAMEKLINEILKLGGQKSRLEVKVFGGGNVIDNSAMIGSKNVSFVKDFLRSEGLKIVSEDLGGNYPRRLHYYPDTGKVMMRQLQRKEDMKIAEEEKRYAKSLDVKPVEGDIDLF